MLVNPFVVTGRQPGPDLDAVRQALRLLVDSSAGFQLTCSPAWPWATFPGTEEGVLAASEWVGEHGDAAAVYYAINPVDPLLASRVKNEDALRRRWLLIDVDRIKTTANLHLSATNDEHAGALALAEQIREELRSEGWPEPALHIDSGNGAHLLYRIDLPNNDESQHLLRRVLLALAARFDGPHGELDRAVHDARRVAKLPGTWARKGPNTPDRPHRLAGVIGAEADPDQFIVSAELLRHAAGAAPPKPASPPGKIAAPAASKLKGPFVVRKASDAAEEHWVEAVLRGECDKMACAQPGDLNNQLFRSAARIGNVIWMGYLSEARAEEDLYQAARDAGADDPRKDRATIRRGIEEGRKTPRGPKEKPAEGQGGQAQTPRRQAANPLFAEGGGWHPVARAAMMQATSAAGGDRRRVIKSAAEIVRTDYPAPRYAVHGIVAEGINVLAGKPKLGKSWLALNLGFTVAVGGVALGNVPVARGKVLYLALEDRYRRVKDRLLKVGGGLGLEPPEDFSISTDWPRLDAGGLDSICEWIEEQGVEDVGGNPVSNVRLIIIDVWTKFRPLATNSRVGAYDLDYAHMGALKYVFDHYGTSGMILHHTRKAGAQDALDEVSGTTGIAGCADGIQVLTRARLQEGEEMEAELFVTSRDAEEQKMALSVDRKTWVWRAHGPASERAEGKLSSAILQIFRNNRGSVLAQREILERLNTEEPINLNTLRSSLNRLAQQDKIERVGTGRYRMPIAEGGETPF